MRKGAEAYAKPRTLLSWRLKHAIRSDAAAKRDALNGEFVA